MHKLFVSFAQCNTRFGSVNFLKAYHMKRKRKVVRGGGLCNTKCLAKRHMAKDCLRINFKCQHSGCGGGHHTLMHRNPVRTEQETKLIELNARDTRQRNQNAGSRDVNPQQQLQPSEVLVRSRNEAGAGNGNE